MTIFIISWFSASLISLLLLAVIDLRGKPYYEEYFDVMLDPTITLIMFGYISLLFACLYILVKNQCLQKLIYKIANIGVNVKEDEEVDL